MSDYWVKPTVDQLRAELEWEREQTKIRKKRRSLLSAIAVAIAVMVIGGTYILPRTGVTGYAMETIAAETEEAVEETEAVQPEEPQAENAVAFGK